jgi:hypothetical protein
MSATSDNAPARGRTIGVRRSPSAPSVDPNKRPRAGRHPISRWYVCPAASRLARALAPTPVRPIHLTLCGLAFGALAAAVLVGEPRLAPLAAAFVLAGWLCDRADGELARRQRTASAWGAWLDANVDELVDVGLHAALAWAASSVASSNGPWLLLIAFLAGKYLLMHGLAVEGCVKPLGDPGESPESCGEWAPSRVGWIVRGLYHLPGNADVRVHLLLAALLTGWFSAELAVVAGYYNLRWIARYALVARRLGGRG